MLCCFPRKLDLSLKIFTVYYGWCSVQLLSRVPTLCHPMDTRLPCPSPSPGACSNSCPLSQRCHPTISSSLLLLLLPSIFPSIRVFSSESVLCIRWPKWSFSFSISTSNEYSGLISFYGPQPCVTQWNYEPCHVGSPKTDRSWWRVLTKRGPLERGMKNHVSIPALRTP